MGEGGMWIRIFAILLSIMCSSEELLVKKVVLEVNEKTPPKVISIGRELLDKGFDVYFDFLVDNTEILDRNLHILSANVLDQKNLVRIILATLFLTGNDQFDEKTNQELQKLHDDTINSILESDQGFKKTLDLFQRISFSPFVVNKNKLYPNWLIETPKGNIILEGFKDDIRIFLNYATKTVNIKKLREFFGDGLVKSQTSD